MAASCTRETPGISYSSCLGPLWKFMWTVSGCLMKCSRWGELWDLDPNSSMEGSQGHSGRAIHIRTCLEEASRDVHFQMSSLNKNWTSDRPGKVFRYTRLIWHSNTILDAWWTTRRVILLTRQSLMFELDFKSNLSTLSFFFLIYTSFIFTTCLS